MRKSFIAGVFAMSQVLAANAVKEASAYGMKVSWHFVGREIIFTMRAPHTGWVAVGLNSREELTGTNLIMGAVENGRAKLSDRTIVRPGHHTSVEGSRGISHVRVISALEGDGSTEIRFALKTAASDHLHFSLKPGDRFSLLMAFSESDDFMHHSLYRTSVWIEL